MKKLTTAILLGSMLFMGMGCNKGPDKNNTTPSEVREKQTLEYAQDFGFKNLNDKYFTVPFYSDNNDAVTYLCNALWEEFGIASGGKVYKLGLNSPWLGIDACKTMWNTTALK